MRRSHIAPDSRCFCTDPQNITAGKTVESDKTASPLEAGSLCQPVGRSLCKYFSLSDCSAALIKMKKVVQNFVESVSKYDLPELWIFNYPY